jgi:hypothetical protein
LARSLIARETKGYSMESGEFARSSSVSFLEEKKKEGKNMFLFFSFV